VKCFSGAAEVMARVRRLGQDALAPGDTGWAQLVLQAPLPLVRGDRFIIRIPSPPATVGGGFVVDPHPGRTHRRSRPEVIARLETLVSGTAAELLQQALERNGPTSAGSLLSNASPEGEERDALMHLVQAGEVILLQASAEGAEMPKDKALLAARSWWSAVARQIEDKLSAHHEAHPLQTGLSREALRSGLRLDSRIFAGVIARAALDGLVVDEGATLRLSSHSVRLTTAQQQAVDGLLAGFTAKPYLTPSVKQSVAAVGEEVLAALVARGDLVQVSPEVLFLPNTYDAMVARICETITKEGSITLAQTRDLLATSRKYAQALLEHLDSQGITKRKGDVRVLPPS
ncbi:MAG: selenocysteine-specific translation factor, partial [Anaerolineales bacterium]